MTYTRPYWLALAMIGFAALVVCKLIQLQVIQGKIYRAQADDNRFFTRYLPAPRGVFRDRNGVVLVKNAPLYKKATEETAFHPYPTLVEIPEREAVRLLAEDERNVVIDQKRVYPFGEALSSMIGYVGEVSQEELKSGLPYYLGESIGRMGLEKVLQEKLVGRPGKEMFEMHATGKLLRKISQEDSFAGSDVDLTIDASFSAEVYRQLEGKQGSVVATDPKTGAVFALVSSPSFDPEHIADALTDEKKPMLQRAITGTYPPGSTFKVITALGGLENGAITTETKVLDEGKLQVGEFTFGNWYFSQYGRTEGEVDIVKALQRSNDIYFYKAAEWLGQDKLAAFARLFHFGRKTGIELSGEAAGVVPDSEWKEKVIGEPWYLGDTYHFGIGQGNLLATPIQINQMTAAVANKGIWCAPRLLQSSKVHCEELVVHQEYLAVVREGMKAACAPGGTAFPFFEKKPVEVACKTGTAEFGPKDEKGYRKTHAWITVMAPADQPQIVLTVLLEADEEHPFLEGSRDAGPIAQRLLQWWFDHE